MKKSVAVGGSNVFAGKVQLSDITHSNTQMTFLTETVEIHYEKQQLSGTKHAHQVAGGVSGGFAGGVAGDVEVVLEGCCRWC